MQKIGLRCAPQCSREGCRCAGTDNTCSRAEPSTGCKPCGRQAPAGDASVWLCCCGCAAGQTWAGLFLSEDVLGQARPGTCSAQQVPVGNLTLGNARRLLGLRLAGRSGTLLQKQITKSSLSDSHKPHKFCPFFPFFFFWALSQVLSQNFHEN